MNSDERDEPDLFEVWLEKLCDGTISDDEASLLNQRLEKDEQARSTYVEFMKMNARLKRLLANPNGKFFDWVVRAAEESREASALASEQLASNGHAESNWRRKRAYQGIAVAVCGLLLTIAWWWNSRVSTIPDNVASTDVSTESAAKIVKKVDCIIESNKWEKDSSSQVAAGDSISLIRGFLTLEFGCGALVRLEGPAEFEVVSAKRGRLQFGKLAAQATKQMNGFCIETPSGEVVDLGTEFGISVDAKGIAETHVFDGEVVVYDKSSRPSGQLHEGKLLTTNQAIRLDRSEGYSQMTEVMANPGAFIRVARERRSTLSNLKRPTTSAKQLVLWLDAGRDVQVDEKFRVVAWPDLAVSIDDADQTAWQVQEELRPYFIDDAINGAPGIRFMGRESLVTEPLTTGNDFSVFVVAKFLPHRFSRFPLATLLYFGSYREFRLSRQMNSAVLARVAGEWDQGKRSFGTSLVSPELAEGEPFLLGFSYNRGENRSLLFINDTLVSTGPATLDLDISKPRLIGVNGNGGEPFVGDLAELMLFDSALSELDCQEVANLLIDKYQLPRSKSPGTP